MKKCSHKTLKEKALNPERLLKKISKNLSKLDKYSFLEKYAVFMGKTQVVEFKLKNILINKFKYNEEKIENMTLGGAIIELGKNGLRVDFIFLLEGLLKHRNSLAHEFLGITAMGNAITRGNFERLQYKELNRALWKVEEVIQVYDWINENGSLFTRKSKNIGKKILIFTEGTIIYHANANGKTREEIIGQVRNKDKYVHQYSLYIPIKHAVNKLKIWYYQGLKITYLTSRKKKKEIKDIEKVLYFWNFPKGELCFRKEHEDYKDVAERVKPDILIEDNCESIGGKTEMTYPHISKKLKKSIKLIIVKEFAGIDDIKL